MVKCRVLLFLKIMKLNDKMVTKAEKLERNAKLALDGAYLVLDIHCKSLSDYGGINKGNALEIVNELSRIAEQHQQIALKHWRRGDRRETVQHVAEILQASRDAAMWAERFRIRPKLNQGWPRFGRAAIFSFLHDAEFDSNLLKLCRFLAPKDIVRQNDFNIIDMHLARCISQGRVDKGFRTFVEKYFRSPRVRIARNSYLGYANLIDSISQGNKEHLLSLIGKCEQNYLDRASDVNFYSFDLGEGAGSANLQEVDYRLAAIIKLIHTKYPNYKRKFRSLHEWRFGLTKPSSERSIRAYSTYSLTENTEFKVRKSPRRQRRIAKPRGEQLVSVSTSGEYVAVTRGQGLSIWRTSTLEEITAIEVQGWRVSSCDWIEESNQLVTLEHLSTQFDPADKKWPPTWPGKPGCPVVPMVQMTWRDAISGKEVTKIELSSSTWRRIGRVVCSPDGKLLAVTSFEEAAVVDPKSGKILRKWKIGEGTYGVAWSPDSTRLFVGNAQFVTCVSTDSSQPIWRARSGQYMIPVAASSDGRYVAFGARKKVRVVCAKSGKSVWQFEAERVAVTSVSFSRHGDRLFVVDEQRRNTFCNEHFARTIELATGKTSDEEKVGVGSWGFARNSDIMIIERDNALTITKLQYPRQ